MKFACNKIIFLLALMGGKRGEIVELICGEEAVVSILVALR